MVRSVLLRGFDQQMATIIGDYMAAHGTRFLHKTVPISLQRVPGASSVRAMITMDLD